MNRKFILLIGLMVLILTQSCEPYEDYTEDYEFSTAYFGTQKPLRTIVAYDDMEFKVGFAMGGKRESNQDEYADFVIDPSLLDNEVIQGAGNFELLPESYYSLSNPDRMTLEAGDFIGDVTVTLNRDNFTQDSLATENHYALPIRLTETSLDSIISGTEDQEGNQILPSKDYTILVVKYISEYDGYYYHKGVQQELDSTGAVVEEISYSESDLIDNQVWNMETVNANTIRTPGIGNMNNGNLILEVNNETVDISSNNANIQIVDGNGEYDAEADSFYLDFTYVRDSIQQFQVADTLILRRPPEEDLRFEEW